MRTQKLIFGNEKKNTWDICMEVREISDRITSSPMPDIPVWEPPNTTRGGPGTILPHSVLFPWRMNGPCRQKGFKTQLECSNCRHIVSDRGFVLKELSIYSAVYCYKHLKKLLHPKRKDKFSLLWKLGGFQGCWCASKQSRARIDNHGRTDRKIYKRLRTTYATSARLVNQVLLPGAHNLGRRWVCHSYHLLAPTKQCDALPTATCKARSANPSSEKSVIYPRICCVSTKPSPQLGSSRNIFEVSRSQRRKRKNTLPTTAQKQLSKLSQRLKGRHTEKSGVWLQKRQEICTPENRLQSTLNAKSSLSQQQASRCAQTGFLYRGKCISSCPASSMALAT